MLQILLCIIFCELFQMLFPSFHVVTFSSQNQDNSKCAIIKERMMNVTWSDDDQ